MRHARAHLARLLACLLLMQWVAALVPHTQALAAVGTIHAVEICSHDGVRTMLLDDEGQPVEKQAAVSCCLLCQAPAAITGTAPEGPVLRITYIQAPQHLREAGLPPGPPRAPPQQPRAPPQA